MDPDPLVGGGSTTPNAEDLDVILGLSPGQKELHVDGIRILSVNVEILTKQRLTTVLQHASQFPEVTIICLQETRHSKKDGPCWAATTAALAGWNSCWSPPPPPMSNQQPTPTKGGTAVLWPKCFGKGKPLQFGHHRACGRAWQNVVVCSAYGPASGVDVGWMTDMLSTAVRTAQGRPLVCAGDFNWRPAYNRVLNDDAFSTAETIPTVLVGTASPTRILVHGDVQAHSSVAHPLPGVPHHASVSWQISSTTIGGVPNVAPERLRRTASFTWEETLSDQEVEEAKQVLDEEWRRRWSVGPNQHGQNPYVCCMERLARWHAAAEDICNIAVQRGYAVQSRQPERRKGSAMSTRPVAGVAANGSEDSIRMRRLKRLHRAATEVWKRNPSAPLAHHQIKHWKAALRDGVVTRDRLPARQIEALAILNAAIIDLGVKEARDRARKWRRRFAKYSTDAIQAAKTILKPPPMPPTLSAEEMRRDWAHVYDSTGDSDARAASWSNYANDCPQLQQPSASAWVPDPEEWFSKIRHMSGAAGPDGWEAHEMKALLRFVPLAMHDLHDVLVGLTRHSAHAPPSHHDCKLLFAWRMVGIPKKDASVRPLSVGSVILRSWLKNLVASLPQLPTGQWGGKAETSVVEAIASWLAHDGDAGSERDLAKAFDTIDHGVGQRALIAQGTDPPVAKFLELCWRGPRYCHIGTIAEPIWPTRGVPQGDPSAPRVTALVLAPWHYGITAVAPSVQTWAFVDDRSTKHAADAPHIAIADAFTDTFDASVGLEENVAKRQTWSHEDSVEHLGIIVKPNVSAPAKPRAGWEPVSAVARRLFEVPGSIEVRTRIAGVFLRPAYQWAASLMEAPPRALIREIQHSITKSACTWWCRGRFWADRIMLHPLLGTAVAAFQQYPMVASWPSKVRNAALKAHAATMNLCLSDVTSDAVWVEPAPGADPRIIQIVTQACPGQQLPLRVNTPKGLHALRVVARITALNAATPVRFDYEGMPDVDIEASSSPRWKKFLAGLPPQDISAVNIYRGGAVWTPSRRFARTIHLGHAACPFCSAEVCSARHLWAECTEPSIAAHRSDLSRKFAIPTVWWTTQPRVTAKTAWITFAAHPSPERRVDLQIAAASLAIKIVQLAGRAM